MLRLQSPDRALGDKRKLSEPGKLAYAAAVRAFLIANSAVLL